MTYARCGLFASTCLTGIGNLPRYALVMVAHVHDMAAARPSPHNPPDSVVAAGGTSPAGACRARGRNSYGGCPHKPLPNADWGGGVLEIRHILGSNRGPGASGERLDLRFILSVGCVFNILGSSLTVSLPVRAPRGPKTASMLASRVDAVWKGHKYAKGYKFTHFGSS